ncbi:MAG TPA: MATE family efflux transporter [Dongiaceae bacterium]|jgi:putative MATE family efflux protein|nr:MATE family efflux transporter [Dongiaceae bacterium]
MTTTLASASSPATAAPRAQAARTRLLLEGPIATTLLRLAVPNLVVNVVLIAVVTSVDAHFVGRLGADALAGLALVFPLMMLMQQMANFSMGGALASSVARAIGAGRMEDASALVLHGLIVGIGMAALFSAAFLLGGPTLYVVMGGSGPILAAAVEYSNAIFAGALAYWLLSTLTSVVRGTGQVAMLAWVYVAAEILHLGLVPLLVFGFGPVPALGITGAGVATIASFTASTLALAWYLASGRTPLKLSWRGVQLEGRLFRDVLRVGAPLSLQPILNNVALTLFTFYAGTLGPATLAGIGAAVRLEYLMYPIVFGLGAAVVAMVGTNIGAGQFARAIRIAWIAAGLAALVTGIVGGIAAIWPQAWIVLFSASPEVAASAATYLIIVALSYPMIGMNTLTQAFQAMGQTFWPLMAVLSRGLIIMVGGWMVITMTSSAVVGLALVTAAGLVVAGTIISAAFWLKMRRRVSASP